MAITALEALRKAQNYVPPQAAEEGEYTLQIRKLEKKVDKNGDDFYLVIFKIEDEPNAADVFHNVSLPVGNEYDDLRCDVLQRFAKSFGFYDDLSVLETDPDTLYGSTGKVHLKLEEDQNGVPRNRIQKFL